MPTTPQGRSAGQKAGQDVDPKLSLAGRLTVAGLCAAALAVGGAGAAYAGSSGDGDSAWVTIVEDDGSSPCPERQDGDGGGL